MSKELLFSITKGDFDITYFSGTGKGGQHRNKHQNCVRLKHKETGVIGTGQSFKSRIQNQKEAFNNVINDPKFKVWFNDKIYQYSRQDDEDKKYIQRKVDNAMKEKNLKIEYGEKFE